MAMERALGAGVSSIPINGNQLTAHQLCRHGHGPAQGTGPVRGAALCTGINTLFFALAVPSLFCKHGVSHPLKWIAALRFQEKPRITESQITLS